MWPCARHRSLTAVHNVNMRISQLAKYRGRNPRGYFQDLTWRERQRAYQWLDRFVKRREATHGEVPAWLFAIYVGQARRLTLNPPDSAWGRRMLAKRGGLACQRRYRLEGKHPTTRATQCRVLRQKARKRASMMLLPTRVKWLPLD
jgi:hypothetical protein